jgi:hypothetical protein
MINIILQLSLALETLEHNIEALHALVTKEEQFFVEGVLLQPLLLGVAVDLLGGVAHVEAARVVASAALGGRQAQLVLGERLLGGAELPLDEGTHLFVPIGGRDVEALGLVALVQLGGRLVLALHLRLVVAGLPRLVGLVHELPVGVAHRRPRLLVAELHGGVGGLAGRLVDGGVAEAGLVVAAARPLQARRRRQVLVEHLLDDVVELLEEAVVDLQRLDVLLAVLLDEVALGQRHVLLPAVEEEDLLVLVEDAVVDLQLLLLRLEHPAEPRTRPPTQEGLVEDARQRTLSTPLGPPLASDVLVNVPEDNHDLSRQVVGLRLEEEVVFEPAETDHALDLAQLLVAQFEDGLEGLVAGRNGRVLQQLHGQVQEEEARQPQVDIPVAI